MKKADAKKAIKRAKLALKAVKIISTCVTVGAAVYALVPKQDKIEGIDTDSLIQKHSAKA